MLMVNIRDAKMNLSRYLEGVAAGERVVICKHNRPVAELRPVQGARTSPRPIGLGAGQLTVPSSFFEALPDEELEAFAGGRPGGVEPAPARASEPRRTYGDPVRRVPRAARRRR
jgi:prevent-host-death family protein